MEVNLSSVNLTVKSVELIVEKLSTRAYFIKLSFKQLNLTIRFRHRESNEIIIKQSIHV